MKPKKQRRIKKIRELKQDLKQWRDSKKCSSCGTKMFLTIHHVIPKSAGGKNDKGNLMVLCRICHDGEHSANSKNKWSEEHIELVMVLKKQGYSYDQISEWLGRTPSSIATQVHNIKYRADTLSHKIWRDSHRGKRENEIQNKSGRYRNENRI